MIHAPGILPEHSQRFVGERVAGTADALDEVLRETRAVSLHGVQVGEGCRICGNAAEVVHPAIIHREGSLEREIVEVASELGVVASDAPGKIVRELVAFLGALDVGVGLASEITVTGNVDGRVGAVWDLGVVEIIQTAAGVLEAEFIHFAAAESPGVLHHAGHITVALSRSARVGVLTEGLVLSAAFDAGDRARAGIDAQHEAVIVVYVVVDAQRVQAGAFKYREVSGLRSQRLVRGGHEAWGRRAGGGKAANAWVATCHGERPRSGESHARGSA